MGKTSHGLMAFPSILTKYSSERKHEMKELKRTDAMIFIDADELPGAYVGKKLADDLVQMADKQGIAVGHVTNMITWLRPGTIARYIADK